MGGRKSNFDFAQENAIQKIVIVASQSKTTSGE
jgi:hypothetical protein